VWHEIEDEIRASGDSKEEKDRRREEERGPHPDIAPATAAAKAIVALGGEHERTVDAAVFLVEQTANVDDMEIGALALMQHAPDHEDWPLLLWNLDFRADPGEKESIDALFDSIAEDASDPVHRAAARYFLASRNMRQVNDIKTAPEDREGYREAAFALAEHMPRERARALVSDACREAKAGGEGLIAVLERQTDAPVHWRAIEDPERYLGSAVTMVDAALST